MHDKMVQAKPARTRLLVPKRGDLLLSKFTELIEGPRGGRPELGTIPQRMFTVERVLIILTVLAALASVVVKGYCRTNGWGTPGQFHYTCYSDIPGLFRDRGLAEGVFPFFTPGSSFEYPVLLGIIAGVTAFVIPGQGATDARTLGYFDLNAALIAAVWIVTVLATARMTDRRPWDAAMVALAPGIVLAGVINWDMWAVCLLAVGMYFFSRQRIVLAGLMIGLGTATKLYPVLILGAILLLALRTGKIRPLLVTAGTAAVTWLAVNLPVAVANPSGWEYFYQFTQSRPAGYSSPWFAYNRIANQLGWTQLDPQAINTLALSLFVLACGFIAAVALAAPRRPRLAQLAFLIVAAFILTNKVYSPQFVIWLIPLLVLARPRWRDFLIWQAIEALHWATVWMYLGHIVSMPYYVLTIILHMLATVYLMIRVIRDIWEPSNDPLRRHGMDDPHGGPFNGRTDWLRLNLVHPTASVLPWRRTLSDG